MRQARQKPVPRVDLYNWNTRRMVQFITASSRRSVLLGLSCQLYGAMTQIGILAKGCFIFYCSLQCGWFYTLQGCSLLASFWVFHKGNWSVYCWWISLSIGLKMKFFSLQHVYLNLCFFSFNAFSAKYCPNYSFLTAKLNWKTYSMVTATTFGTSLSGIRKET